MLKTIFIQQAVLCMMHEGGTAYICYGYYGINITYHVYIAIYCTL